MMVDDMCVAEEDAEQRLTTFNIKKRLESSYLNPLPTDIYVLAAEVVVSTSSTEELTETSDIERTVFRLQR